MPSFDIVSKVPWNEVDNALNQTHKEIIQRYDFKDTETTVERTSEGIAVRSGASEERAKAAVGVLQEKLVRRKVSLRHFEVGEPEPTGKAGARILVKVKEGIEIEKARAIVKLIKDTKLKVQGSIQENQVRVSGKHKDDLQAAIRTVRANDFGIELQFINYRD